jgi:ATP-dependent Clp protease ATP-binding subunit ClpA
MLNIPNWQKELEIYLSLKTTILLEGNILDLQPIVQQTVDDDDETKTVDIVVYDSTEKYLYNLLKKRGYEVIVFFNMVDDIYNYYDDKMVEKFFKIIKEQLKNNGFNLDGEVGEGVLDFKSKIIDKFNNFFKSNNHNKQIKIISNIERKTSKFTEIPTLIRLAMKSTSSPIAIVLNHASRLKPNNNDSGGLSDFENFTFTELLLASSERKTSHISKTDKKIINNSLIMLTEVSSDIPKWLYFNKPNVQILKILDPDKKARLLFVEEQFDSFYNTGTYEEVELNRLKNWFVDLTNGFKNTDLVSIRDLTRNEKIEFKNIDKAINLYRYGIRENPWTNDDMVQKLKSLKANLEKNVIGQEKAVNTVVSTVKRAIYGLSGAQHSTSKAKPRGVMFLGGPTGTGKTEMAKALAEAMFGDKEAYIRFDMSEYSSPASDQRLFGAPPGYVGYDAGGQLTTAIKDKPFSIVLFDEIEKAHPSVLDKFLQILEDGRLTDGKGQTAYFSDTIIIFTSNLGTTKKQLMEGSTTNLTFVPTVTYKDFLKMKPEEYEKIMRDQIENDFKFEYKRPELLNRIGENIIIFNFIKDDVALKIANSQIKKIVKFLKEEKNYNIEVSEKVIEKITNQRDKAMNGRGVGNVIEAHFLNPLTDVIENNFEALKKSKIIKIVDVDFKQEKTTLKVG